MAAEEIERLLREYGLPPLPHRRLKVEPMVLAVVDVAALFPHW